MSKFVMKDAFPKTPQGFEQRVHETLDKLQEVEQMTRRTKLTTAMIAALIAVLLIAGLAFAAAQSQLLQKLFPNTTPNPLAQSLATRIDLKEHQNGMTFSVDEYLMDGSDLYVFWTATSEAEENVILTNVHMKTDHQPMSESVNEYGTLHMGEGIVLGDELWQRPISRSYSTATRIYNYSQQAPDKPIQVTLSAQFVRSALDIEKDTGLERDAPGEALVLSEDFDLPIVSQYIYTQDEYGQWSGLTTDIANTASTPITTVEITFTIQPDPSNMLRTEINGPDTFEFDTFSIHFTRLEFSAASTHIEYEIIPKNNATGPTPDWSFREMWLQVLPDGQPLQKELSQQKDGGDLPKFCELWGDALPVIPKTVTITPICYKQGQTNNKTLLPQYQMQIPLH